MREEIIKDNEKLRLAVCHSDSFIKPINIIFCTSEKMKRSDKKIPVIEQVKTFVSGDPIKLYDDPHTIYHSPAEVLTIFTESFIHKEMKKTEKPISNFDGFNTKLKWANDLINLL